MISSRFETWGGAALETGAIFLHKGYRPRDRLEVVGRIAFGRVASEAELVAALRPLTARITADADRIDADARASAELDRMSVARCLDRAGARGLVRTLLESSIRTEYGVEPSETSALELIWNLPTVEGERFEVLGASDERYAIAGGSARLTDALAGGLRDRIQTGRRLVRLGYAGSRLSLSFADGSAVETDRVVLAIPASLYRSIRFDVGLPRVWRDFLAEVNLICPATSRDT